MSTDHKQHTVWSTEDLFHAARAGIPPRDSGRSPTHPDNWEATNAIAALKELELQMQGLAEQYEGVARERDDLRRLASPTAMQVIAEKVDAEIEVLRLKKQLEVLRRDNERKEIWILGARDRLDHLDNVQAPRSASYHGSGSDMADASASAPTARGSVDGGRSASELQEQLEALREALLTVAKDAHGSGYPGEHSFNGGPVKMHGHTLMMVDAALASNPASGGSGAPLQGLEGAVPLRRGA